MLFSYMGCCPTECQAGHQVGLVLGFWRISLTQRSNSPRRRAVEVAWGSILTPAVDTAWSSVSETGSRLPELPGGSLGPVRGSCSTFAVAET